MSFSEISIILVCNLEDGVLDGKDLRVMIFGKVRIKLQLMLHLCLMHLNCYKLIIMYEFIRYVVYDYLSQLYYVY